MANTYTTSAEIRRENLARVIEQVYGGVGLRLAEALKVSNTQVNRVMSESSSRRDMGDKMARDIEEVAGLPRGWMDHQHNELDDAYLKLLALPKRQQASVLVLIESFLE